MVDFENIKLIIWDLDETFWKGTLSEGKVIVPQKHIDLINNTVDSGVMISICSKNDKDKAISVLKEYDIADLFVFPSIDWAPKGMRVKQIIKDMQLRADNVLFIDDNFSNREEAKYYSPNLIVGDVDVIKEMFSYYSSSKKRDPNRKRLKQYQLLEKKFEEKSLFSSNEEFLFASQIVVSINHNSEQEIERIHELVLRSNQLNFTKLRSSKEELLEDIQNPKSVHGYICVKDKFGDYGIVGFYLLFNGKAKHFVFSCRTLGMGVEQYVFNYLGRPKIDIIGEIASDLNSTDAAWINTQNGSSSKIKSIKKKIVIKGPCDMAQTTLYLTGNNLITEFTYVNKKGIVIEQCNHTSIICDSIRLTNEEKNDVVKNAIFADKDMYNTRLFDKDVSMAVLSLFVDPNLGLYRDKQNGFIIPFCEFTNDLTDESNWDSLIQGNVYNANCKFSHKILEDIKNNYIYIGRLQPEQVVQNIEYILEHLGQSTTLCLILGSTTPFLKNVIPCYDKREDYNKKLNMLIYKLAKKDNRIFIVDVNEFISGQNSFTNNINHFQRIVYYNISLKLIEAAQKRNIFLNEDTKFNTFFRRYSRKLTHLLLHPISLFKERKNRKKVYKHE